MGHSTYFYSVVEQNKIQVQISFLTFAKFLFAIFLCYIFYVLWPLVMLFFLALLLAVTMTPFVIWFERRLPRWLAILIVTMSMLLAVVIVGVMIFPPLIDQFFDLIEKFPGYAQKVLASIPTQSPLRRMGERMIKNPDTADAAAVVGHILTYSQLALGGLTSAVLVFVTSIYMIIDGKRSFDWFIAFFPHTVRPKLKMTLSEVSVVIFAYVAGQAITSLACGIFAFALLSYLDVPNALMLGFLAAVMDVLPVLGFILAVIPAIIAGLAVSNGTAIIILVAYLGYHAFENYFLVPLVYGNRLRLSSLAVLLSLLAGGLLAGILGAIAILPIVASYPIIERIWLSEYLGREVISDHQKADQTIG